jgi:hypothetical protein
MILHTVCRFVFLISLRWISSSDAWFQESLKVMRTFQLYLLYLASECVDWLLDHNTCGREGGPVTL